MGTELALENPVSAGIREPGQEGGDLCAASGPPAPQVIWDQGRVGPGEGMRSALKLPPSDPAESLCSAQLARLHSANSTLKTDGFVEEGCLPYLLFPCGRHRPCLGCADEELRAGTLPWEGNLGGSLTSVRKFIVSV